MRNHSHEKEHVSKTYFHMKGSALVLVLKQRSKETRKLPILECSWILREFNLAHWFLFGFCSRDPIFAIGRDFFVQGINYVINFVIQSTKVLVYYNTSNVLL